MGDLIIQEGKEELPTTVVGSMVLHDVLTLWEMIAS